MMTQSPANGPGAGPGAGPGDGGIASGGEPRRRGRPPSAAKREAIVRAALAAFLRDGFTGTTIETVAATAGVSRQTVYSHFGDKESLFLAVATHARTAAGLRPATAAPLLVEADVREALVAFGERQLSVTMHPEVAALRRMMIGEVDRHPGLRDLWLAGFGDGMLRRLADELVDRVARGELRLDDPASAAGNLAALLGFHANNRTLYGTVPLGAELRRTIATEAADMFCRAYQARPADPVDPVDPQRTSAGRD